MRKVGSVHGSFARSALGAALGALLVVGSLTACGNSDIGEKCDVEGRVGGECVDGAVCGKQESAGGLVCLKQCSSQSDCKSEEECNGVNNSSLKGCRLKKL